MAVTVEAKVPSALQKTTTFHVLGMCCSSEAAIIHKILNPLPGIENVSVNVSAKTATIVHDPTLIPASQIVNSLNDARLNAEIRELGQFKTRKLSWPSTNTLCSGALMVVALFGYIYPPLKWVALAAIAVGIPNMLLRSVTALRRCMLDINVLMVIAVSGAVALGDYLEGASVVFLFTLAGWLETKSTEKARASLESLMELAPRTAVIAETGERIPVKDIRLHTVISVKAGECIAVDGVVAAGQAAVDESSLTGEFMPVDKEIGSKVWAGTMVLTGFINVRTEALEEDSAVARMVKLVEDAQNQCSRMELFIERFAKYYTPGVVLIAAGLAVIPWALGLHDFQQWIYIALVLLVVACPCALVISTPIATACGLSAAAKMGLLVKGGNYFEVLAKIKTIAFDKTGTLTQGKFAVTDMQCIESQTDSNQMLYWISSLENQSSHPMATSLVTYARLHGIEPATEVQNFESIPGEGIYGLVNNHIIQIGNARLAQRNGWMKEGQCHINEAGVMVGYVGVDGRLVGFFCLADQIRSEAIAAVQELQKLGIQVIILTGDSNATAELIGQQIGNVRVESGLAPAEKVKRVAELKKEGSPTAMVGDGINDAPALAAADLGIAMGVAGSAVAIETADVALMSNDLRKIPEAVKLARECMRKVYQNVGFSLGVKAVFLGLAFAGVASLWAAVFADMGTCLLVIFNSMLLLRQRKMEQQQNVRISGSSSKSEREDDLLEPLLSLEEGGEREENESSCCRKGCCGEKRTAGSA
ncbi:cadmium/zinc-transporting ATPase HMA2-like [Magnolia sinica]|uniref:cadmium/zinc-transporting ATPase HMA2-like n=1 Tax=Magnolia sinica TaxID=86752 RepID=UPI00265912C4|nr:cadmium/zinc-transporting ATPase HMA2-like [Magnolia sinica]